MVYGQSCYLNWYFASPQLVAAGGKQLAGSWGIRTMAFLPSWTPAVSRSLHGGTVCYLIGSRNSSDSKKVEILKSFNPPEPVTTTEHAL